MSKSPRLRGPKLHEECYTMSPKFAHSFVNGKNNFDIKLMLNYCALKGIKPPTDEIKDFDDLHAKAKQTVINININILSDKKSLEAGKKKAVEKRSPSSRSPSRGKKNEEKKEAKEKSEDQKEPKDHKDLKDPKEPKVIKKALKKTAKT